MSYSFMTKQEKSASPWSNWMLALSLIILSAEMSWEVKFCHPTADICALDSWKKGKKCSAVYEHFIIIYWYLLQANIYEIYEHAWKLNLGLHVRLTIWREQLLYGTPRSMNKYDVLGKAGPGPPRALAPLSLVLVYKKNNHRESLNWAVIQLLF